MSDDLEPQQFFVKTDAGKVMGPLTFTTIELLAESGALGKRCQCSIDGLNFAWPSRFPDLFEAFPEEMRGPAGGGPPITRDSAPPPPAPTRAPGAPPRGAPPVMQVPSAATGSGPRPAAQPPPVAAPVAPVAPPAPTSPVGVTPPTSGARPAVQVPPAKPAMPAMPIGGSRPVPAVARPPAPPRVVEVVPVGAPLPELIPSGPIRGGAPFRLYYLVAAQALAGELKLHTPTGSVFTLHFKKGACELAKSDDPALSLVDFLQKKGALQPAQAQQAEAASGQFGGEILNALFGLGLLNPAAAFPLLGEHARLVVERALQLDGGHFTWNDKAPSPAMTIPIGGNKWGPLCDAGRRLDRNVIGRRLGDQIDCPVMKAGDGLAKLEDLRLNAQETRVVANFDGTRSLAELAVANPAEAEIIYRTAWFLGEVGFASFANSTRPRPDGTPVFGEAPRAAAAPVDAPAAPVDAAPAPGPALEEDFGLDFADGLDVEPPPAAPPVAAPRPAAPPVAAPKPVAPPVAAPKPAAPVAAPKPAAPPVAAPKPAVPPVAAPKPAAPPVAAPKPAAPPVAAPPKPAAPPRTPIPGKPATPPPAPPPTDAASLKAHLEKLKKQDLFEVLGVKRDATAAVTKAAFFAQAKLYHPDMAGADATPEMRTLREDITARLNEAFATLSDDYQRGEYLASLEMGGASKEDVIKILNAEEAFQMGAIMVKARRFQDGLAKLEEAISLNPQEGEFYAWRAFAKFTLASDKRAAKAAADADLQKCRQLNPKCASAWLFQARMLVVVGDSAGGGRAYRKCLELDEKNSDAERELKALERMGK